MGKWQEEAKKLDLLSRSNFPCPLLSCCLGSADVVSLREEMQLLEHFLLFTRKVEKSLWDFQGFRVFHLEEQHRTQAMSLLSAMGVQ